MQVTQSFEFTTQQKGNNAEMVQLLIKGLYYPEKCDNEGLSYDIEEVWSGYYTKGISFTPKDNLTTAFQICARNEDSFSVKIQEATEAHIEYLTGYAAKEDAKHVGEMPDIFESLCAAMRPEFPNGNTYPVLNTTDNPQFFIPVS